MISSQEMSAKDISGGELGMKVKKPSQNYLYFKTRARSRSFGNLSDLFTDDEQEKSQEASEIRFGWDEEGKTFRYSPSDPKIKIKYIEVKELFQEILSPTVVSLMTALEDGKVG